MINYICGAGFKHTTAPSRIATLGLYHVTRKLYTTYYTFPEKFQACQKPEDGAAEDKLICTESTHANNCSTQT